MQDSFKAKLEKDSLTQQIEYLKRKNQSYIEENSLLSSRVQHLEICLARDVSREHTQSLEHSKLSQLENDLSLKEKNVEELRNSLDILHTIISEKESTQEELKNNIKQNWASLIKLGKKLNENGLLDEDDSLTLSNQYMNQSHAIENFQPEDHEMFEDIMSLTSRISDVSKSYEDKGTENFPQPKTKKSTPNASLNSTIDSAVSGELSEDNSDHQSGKSQNFQEDESLSDQEDVLTSKISKVSKNSFEAKCTENFLQLEAKNASTPYATLMGPPNHVSRDLCKIDFNISSTRNKLVHLDDKLQIHNSSCKEKKLKKPIHRKRQNILCAERSKRVLTIYSDEDFSDSEFSTVDAKEILELGAVERQMDSIACLKNCFVVLEHLPSYVNSHTPILIKDIENERGFNTTLQDLKKIASDLDISPKKKLYSRFKASNSIFLKKSDTRKTKSFLGDTSGCEVIDNGEKLTSAISNYTDVVPENPKKPIPFRRPANHPYPVNSEIKSRWKSWLNTNKEDSTSEMFSDPEENGKQKIPSECSMQFGSKDKVSSENCEDLQTVIEKYPCFGSSDSIDKLSDVISNDALRKENYEFNEKVHVATLSDSNSSSEFPEPNSDMEIVSKSNKFCSAIFTQETTNKSSLIELESESPCDKNLVKVAKVMSLESPLSPELENEEGEELRFKCVEVDLKHDCTNLNAIHKSSTDVFKHDVHKSDRKNTYTDLGSIIKENTGSDFAAFKENNFKFSDEKKSIMEETEDFTLSDSFVERVLVDQISPSKSIDLPEFLDSNFTFTDQTKAKESNLLNKSINLVCESFAPRKDLDISFKNSLTCDLVDNSLSSTPKLPFLTTPIKRKTSHESSELLHEKPSKILKVSGTDASPEPSENEITELHLELPGASKALPCDNLDQEHSVVKDSSFQLTMSLTTETEHFSLSNKVNAKDPSQIVENLCHFDETNLEKVKKGSPKKKEMFNNIAGEKQSLPPLKLLNKLWNQSKGITNNSDEKNSANKSSCIDKPPYPSLLSSSSEVVKDKNLLTDTACISDTRDNNSDISSDDDALVIAWDDEEKSNGQYTAMKETRKNTNAQNQNSNISSVEDSLVIVCNTEEDINTPSVKYETRKVNNPSSFSNSVKDKNNLLSDTACISDTSDNHSDISSDDDGLFIACDDQDIVNGHTSEKETRKNANPLNQNSNASSDEDSLVIVCSTEEDNDKQSAKYETRRVTNPSVFSSDQSSLLSNEAVKNFNHMLPNPKCASDSYINDLDISSDDEALVMACDTEEVINKPILKKEVRKGSNSINNSCIGSDFEAINNQSISSEESSLTNTQNNQSSVSGSKTLEAVTTLPSLKLLNNLIKSAPLKKDSLSNSHTNSLNKQGSSLTDSYSNTAAIKEGNIKIKGRKMLNMGSSNTSNPYVIPSPGKSARFRSQSMIFPPKPKPFERYITIQMDNLEQFGDIFNKMVNVQHTGIYNTRIEEMLFDKFVSIIPSQELLLHCMFYYLQRYRHNPFLKNINYGDVLLSQDELCWINVLFRLEEAGIPHFRNITEVVVQTISQILLSRSSMMLYTLGGMCRVFTGICKRLEDPEKPLKFCSDVLKMKHKNILFYISCVAGVWKEIFLVQESLSGEEKIFRSAISFVAKKNLRAFLKYYPQSIGNIQSFIDKTFVFPRNCNLPTVHSLIHTLENNLKHGFNKTRKETYDIDKGLSHEEELVVSSLIILTLYNKKRVSILKRSVLPNLENYQSEGNLLGFKVFSDIYATIVSRCQDFIKEDFLTEIFENNLHKKGDTMCEIAAVSLIKIYLERNEGVPSKLQSWYEKNIKNPVVAPILHMFKRKIYSKIKTLTPNDIFIP